MLFNVIWPTFKFVLGMARLQSTHWLETKWLYLYVKILCNFNRWDLWENTMYFRWGSSNQDGTVGIPLTGLILPYLLCLSQTRTWISNDICRVFFCVQWFQRGDCSFCWYWWNWLPWLFKLSVQDIRLLITLICDFVQLTIYFVLTNTTLKVERPAGTTVFRNSIWFLTYRVQPSDSGDR